MRAGVSLGPLAFVGSDAAALGRRGDEQDPSVDLQVGSDRWKGTREQDDRDEDPAGTRRLIALVVVVEQQQFPHAAGRTKGLGRTQEQRLRTRARSRQQALVASVEHGGVQIRPRPCSSPTPANAEQTHYVAIRLHTDFFNSTSLAPLLGRDDDGSSTSTSPSHILTPFTV